MKRKILCVCFGNTCRSPMLQAFLSEKLRDKDFTVESAGLADRFGASASLHAVECMRKKGLDITNHRSRKVSDLALISYDHIYCVEEALVPQLIALGAPKDKIEVVEVSNPYGKDFETYRTCAEVLSRLATTLASKLNQ